MGSKGMCMRAGKHPGLVGKRTAGILAAFSLSVIGTSALVSVGHAAQFDVTAAALNGDATQVGSAAWALSLGNDRAGNDVVDFDQSINLVLSVPQTLLNDTTFQINKHLVVNAALSGSGGLTKTGTGYLVLVKTNALSGDINLLQGGLVVTAGDAIDDNANVHMVSGAEFEIIGSETIGSLSGAGALMGSELSHNTLTFGGNGASTSFAFESPVLNILGNDACYELTLVKTGTGTFTITGAAVTEGSLLIQGGKLVMNGSTDMFAEVSSGAALGGSGRLASVVVNGTLAPGNSIGTIRTGDVTFNAGSTLQVEIAGAGNVAGVNNDLVDVTGVATIDGGTVQILGGNVEITAPTFTILTATGGVVGTFDRVTDDLAFYRAALNYDANNVYADLIFTGFAGAAGLSPAQQATAQALDTAPGGSVYASAMQGVTDSNVGDALDQLSGQGHASRQSATMEQSGHLERAAFDRVGQAFAALGASNHNSYAPSATLSAPAALSNIWGGAYGGVIQRAATAGAQATDSASGGLVLGLDGEIAPDWRLGVMASAGLERFTAGNLTADSTSAAAGVYLGGRAGIVDIKAGAAYSRHFVQSSRAVTFGGLSDTLSAQYQAGTAQVFGEVSHEFDLGAASITPFGRIAALRTDTDGFSETGGAGALNSAASSSLAAYTTLGLSADYAFVLNDTMLGKVMVSAGWDHLFGGDTSVSNSFIAGGDSFVVGGAPAVRDALRLGSAFSLDVSANFALAAKYDGRIGEGMTAHAVSLQFAGQF